jgi:hypothetical protein
LFFNLLRPILTYPIATLNDPNPGLTYFDLFRPTNKWQCIIAKLNFKFI